MRILTLISAAFFVILCGHLQAQSSLEWTLGSGDNASLFQEANWIDPATGLSAPAGSVERDTPLNRSLIIRAGTPGGGSGASANLQLGSGSLRVSGATLRMNKANAAGINLGSADRSFMITDATVLSQNVINAEVTMNGRSELTLYGPAPLVGTTIDLQSSDCFVLFLDRLPTEVDGTYLSDRFTVDGAPAVVGSNIQIRQYYNGTAVRATPPGGIALKAFDLPDLLGTQWNFNTGFKGSTGLGASSYNAANGQYQVDGWGNDIWGSADQLHFVHRRLSGNGTIIARVNSVADANTWTKAGLMIREDLAAGSRNAFLLQRPDGAVYRQARTASGGDTSSNAATAGDWLRLTRTGNNVAYFTSTSSSSGPWTQVGTTTLAGLGAVEIGLAMTSHIGVERARSVFSQVSVFDSGSAVSASGALGVFDTASDIQSVWNRDNRISSFLLKRGYMVTVSEDPAGQGFSKFYAATEADLMVNLPPELNNKISFMRVLPWRWIAKKGWAGSNSTHLSTIGARWNYEWEPTGASNLNREFVPMILGRGQNRDFRWEEVRVRGNQTHFLGFNEPESPNQGDLSVAEALALWPRAQQLGLRLGSPGRTDNANGNAWLSDFMNQADAAGYRVDYVCVHNYRDRTATALKNWLDAEYAKYNRPIWLTEFQRDVDADNPDAADHEAYLAAVLPMLESLDYLERYAYYNFNTANPNNGFASLFNGDLSANAKGQLYAGTVSNPGYRNTDQPAWATASTSLPSGGFVQAANSIVGVQSSLDPSLIGSVEFFANGVSLGSDNAAPFESPSLDSLSTGSYTLTAVITTTFGETLSTTARQVFLAEFGLLPSPGPNGAITWSSVAGERYRLEVSTNLVTWMPVLTRTAAVASASATDPNYGTSPHRFYRVVWLP